MKIIVVKILNILAKKILAKNNPVVIGITGSIGKSSAQKAICKILSKKYKVVYNKGDYNTDLSIPLAIIGLDARGRDVFQWAKVIIGAMKIIIKGTNYPDILVLEMGVDRPEDMKKMLKIIKPDIGILTNIGKFPSHIKYFKNVKHVAREKSLLIKSLGKNNTAILNYDDSLIKELSENIKAKTITYGFDCNSDLRAEEIFLGDKKWKTEDGKTGMSFKISYKGTTVPFRLLHALGRGQIYTILSAVAVGLHFGFNLVEISEILRGYQSPPGRMRLMRGIKSSLIIDDSFNANPNSSLAALETLEKLEAKRKIAVLGDMLELGEHCEPGHREVGRRVPKSADFLFAYGSRSKIILEQAVESGMKKNKVFYFKDINELIASLKNAIEKYDVVLVKGSRAMHMERVVREIMAKPEKMKELLVE